MDTDDSGESPDLVQAVYQYITEGTYPDNLPAGNSRRIVRKKAQRFAVQDGELYYKQRRNKVEVLLRFVTSIEERTKILRACHVDPTAGHLGKTTTVYRIKERFMWHGVVQDVKEMIEKCDVCQRMNRKLTTGVPELHPVKVHNPWHHLGIDFVRIDSATKTPTQEGTTHRSMVMCDSCHEWYHAECVPQVPQAVWRRKNTQWLCNSCS